MTAPLTAVPDPEPSLDELAERIVGLAGRLAAATCRWLLLVADFDRREGYRHFLLSSTARWLAHSCGLSRRTAIEHVRVARALAAHRPLADGMRAGRLSFSHVRAISRIADLGDAALVERLVDVAEHGTVGQLEDTVRGLRTVDDNQRELPDQDVEYVRTGWRPNSQWGMTTRLDPERGTVVQAALERIANREGCSRADALFRMAEIALAAAESDAPAPGLRGDELVAVQVQLDAAALRLDEDEGCSAEHPSAPPAEQAPETPRPPPRPAGRILRGPGLPDRVLKRLLCSGRIRTAVLDGTATPLDLGRRHRVVTPKQFAALMLRDRGSCAFPGCTTTVGLEAHHVRHWISGGRTDLANLVLLCRRHHAAHHDGEFRIAALSRGAFSFERRDGRPLPRRVHASRYDRGEGPVEDEHAHVAGQAARTRWDGTRLDRHYAIATLAQHLSSTSMADAAAEARQRRWQYWDPWRTRPA